MRSSRSPLRPAPRRRLWPFGRRRNRRVRSPSYASLPAVQGEPARPPSTKTRTGQDAPRRFRWGQLGRFLALTLVVAGAAAGAHQFLTRSAHFAVREIKVSKLEHVSPESIQARAGIALGTNLFSVDLAEVARAVQQEPWVKSARARRELPGTITIDVVERQASCVVAMGALYLADRQGAVFKRANPDEAASLPVVTGIERDVYLSDAEGTQAEIRGAVAVLDAWRAGGERPAAGEIHLDHLRGVTVFTAQGLAVRLGRVDETLEARLRRFDAVWASLAETGERARVIHLDNRARPDRVTVKLAAPARPDPAKKSET